MRVRHQPADVVRAVFYSLGSDGTVGANRTRSDHRRAARRPSPTPSQGDDDPLRFGPPSARPIVKAGLWLPAVRVRRRTDTSTRPRQLRSSQHFGPAGLGPSAAEVRETSWAPPPHVVDAALVAREASPACGTDAGVLLRAVGAADRHDAVAGIGAIRGTYGKRGGEVVGGGPSTPPSRALHGCPSPARPPRRGAGLDGGRAPPPLREASHRRVLAGRATAPVTLPGRGRGPAGTTRAGKRNLAADRPGTESASVQPVPLYCPPPSGRRSIPGGLAMRAHRVPPTSSSRRT